MAATQTSSFARHHILPEGFDHEVLSPDRESSSRAICAASFQRIRVPGLSGQETQSQKNGRWGHQIKKIVTQPWQFELWMTRRRKIENLSPDDPRYRRAARIADAVLGGHIPDPTSGATRFLNEAIVRLSRGGSLPRWAQGEGLVIGRHTFYSPDEAGARIGQASLALMFMQLASMSC
jgi:Cell Wall Hydrolase